jgi:hypothetical protein
MAIEEAIGLATGRLSTPNTRRGGQSIIRRAFNKLKIFALKP